MPHAVLTDDQFTNMSNLVTALKSGNYQQGRSKLRQLIPLAPTTTDAYCCFGVMCDLYDPKNWDTPARLTLSTSYPSGARPVNYMNKMSFAPDHIEEAYGFYHYVDGDDENDCPVYRGLRNTDGVATVFNLHSNYFGYRGSFDKNLPIATFENNQTTDISVINDFSNDFSAVIAVLELYLVDPTCTNVSVGLNDHGVMEAVKTL